MFLISLSDGADISLARSRSRRTKLDKKGRFAALEKLKKVKETGHAHKYEVSINENIFLLYARWHHGLTGYAVGLKSQPTEFRSQQGHV